MKKRSLAALVLGLFAAFAPTATAAPVRLARTPDYHAGKIAFGYLGDIWTVNEDGSNPVRLTVSTGREINPRFSPDGKWIAFSSNRHGNQDVFVVAANGGVPRRLTFHTGADEVTGWSTDSKNIVFRASHGDGVFPGTATLYQVPATGGPETPLPVDWGWWGTYAPDGRHFLFNRHPSVWSRKHYRGSYAADIWIGDLQAKTYRQLLAGEKFNRFWPMWGPKDEIYFVADPLPNEKAVKPGSDEVRRSANNIYKVAAAGTGQPVQVTKHVGGNVFYPSISNDGKVIVYEADFGLWKLDTATGRSSEVKIDIVSDEKENTTEMVTITNEADSFDLSPSGRRAVISSKNQLFTIATERGDITLLGADKGASRNESPQWSPDGKLIAFISDRSGRQEVYVAEPDGKNLKKISDLDSDKGPVVWAPDSKSLVYGSTDKKLYAYTFADAKTAVLTSTTLGAPRSPEFSPDSKWVSFVKTDATGRSHAYVIPAAGGQERHITDDTEAYSETSAVWTGDGRYIVYIVSAGTGSGIASTGGRAAAQMQLRVLPLRAQDRDPLNKDIDNEEQGLAAEAAARGGRAGAGGGAGQGGGGGATPPVEVRIDWDGLTTRARRIEVSGTVIGGLTAAPTGSTVAFTAGSGGGPGGGGGAGGGEDATSTYTVNVADGSTPARVPAAPQTAGAGGGGGGGGGGQGGGARMAFTRDGRTLYFRSGRGIYSAPIAASTGDTAAAARGGGGGGGGRGGAAPATSASPAPSTASAKQITFTINMELDREARRRQVFEEGWRVMKNRFYDPKMHGADWNAARLAYGSLLENVTDDDELRAVMMQMIGELNASHTGVNAAPNPPGTQGPPQTRYPGFELEPDASGYYKVDHIWKDGPVDHDYVKIKKGDFILAVNDRELKTTDSYWRDFTMAAGRKFHFLVNNKPVREGAWEIVVEPMAGQAYTNAQYAKWVADRRAMVDKLSNGDIGYLHIRAMDAPSLRQFTLDLAMNRTKKALVIDQRFNGGGGIDQELLGILMSQKYQYTRGRDAGMDIPRPLETFYGPMVVMQNERSASDAEMFPQGFKDLKLGKVIGVPTMGAVIGTGSYTLSDGSTIRTPGSGVWTARGENMENFGAQPDVWVDNSPDDFIKGRDAQIEKAVEVLKAEIAAGAGKRIN
jgi:tricorn protease